MGAGLGEAATEADVTGDRAGADQGLVLPGPGALLLVGGIGFEAADEQAGAAVGTQADVDFIEPARARQHGQKVHEALGEAGVVARTLERLLAIRFEGGMGAVVDEDEVEVRAEAEFDAAEAAVTDHGHAGTLARSIIDMPVRGDKVAFGDAQHGGEDRFGDRGQRTRSLHRIDALAEKGQADAEVRGQALFLDHLDFALEIVVGHRAEAAQDFGLDLLAVGGRAFAAIVEQFVEQQRMGDHAIGQQSARREHAGQALQRHRLFVEQGQVGGAAGDRMDQADQANQAGAGRATLCRGREQGRHHAIDALSRARGRRPQDRTAEQAFERGDDRFERFETGFDERLGIDVAGGAALPQRAPFDGLRRGAGALRRRHHRIELLADRRPVAVQRGDQVGPGRMTEGQRDTLALGGVRGQFMGLLVGEHLHAVFEPAQEAIGLGQALAAPGADQSELLAGRECRQQAAHAQ